MHRVHVVAITIASALAFGCIGAGDGRRAEGTGGEADSAPRAAIADAGAGGVAPSKDVALEEFEPLGDADIALYLKVLRAAGARVRNMSEADRRALRTFREYTEHAQAMQRIPTAEQMAAIQRAGRLIAQDAAVAREMGVVGRYGSIEDRVDRFLSPLDGSSGRHEELTAERRVWPQDRINRFAERDRLDAQKLSPFRVELESLRARVKFAVHPGSMAR